MIITFLTGGLGNQLFEYAVGRKLALKHKTNLYIDTLGFRTYKRHRYALAPFNIQAKQVNDIQLWWFKFLDLFGSSKPYYQRPVVQEQNFYYDPNIENVPGNAYLHGYWHSEKYFEDIKDVIRKDITLKEKQNPEYYELLEEIKNSNSVSLHVRRSDYLSKKNVNVFAVCSPDYYKQALDIISKKAGQLKIFVFSDDIEWVKNNIPLNFPAKFVSASTGFAGADYQELMLMSACKHNITANSTFSWWGAWLNNNPDKIVVTPEKWVVDASRHNKDLIPQGWVKI